MTSSPLSTISLDESPSGNAASSSKDLQDHIMDVGSTSDSGVDANSDVGSSVSDGSGELKEGEGKTPSIDEMDVAVDLPTTSACIPMTIDKENL